MTSSNFIHLSVHSAYSLSEGAIPLTELIKLTTAQKMPALALTDSGNLFAALEFATMAGAAGIKPIIGCQITLLSDESAHEQYQLGSHRITLLVQNETGWRNLIKLVSISFLENEKMQVSGQSAIHTIAPPHVTLDLLSRYEAGIIAFSGGYTGEIALKLRHGQDQDAKKHCDRLAGIFKERFYIEIQRFPDEESLIKEGEQRSPAQIEEILLDWAYDQNLPLIATNDVYFPHPDMYEAHDVLLAVAEGVTRDVSPRRRVTPHHFFKSAAQMTELFADLPEAIANSVVIAQRCSFWPKSHDPILPPFLDDSDQAERAKSESALLRKLAENGLKQRLLASPPAHPYTEQDYRDRLDFEISVIKKMGYEGYFLIVADFINWAKDRDIPVGPGRGSGVGSLVAYAMQITALDPLPFGLLFERFLNPERVSLPDFDVDFCQDRRDEVIDYVRQRYGDDRVAQIITFGKFQARAVLRDVGRVLAMPYAQVDRICKIVPQNPANPVSLEKAIKSEPQLQAQRDNDPDVKKLLEIGMQLEGLYRHASTHAAGVVISDRPLTEIIPLYRDARASLPATQYSMKLAEKAGLVKFDFLGLKTLTVIAKTIKLIEQSEKITIKLTELPFSDDKVWKMLARGDTTGVFQLESSGMRDVVMKLKIDSFEEIIAVVSLFRPGPMENIPSFIARKHGDEKVNYLHPKIEGILRETFGIMVYQEQVMQITQILAGFSLGDADLLRRAMGKKDPKEMASLRARFAEGAKTLHNIEEKNATEIFDTIEKFAGYGFNKSHAAAYALVSWQTAWLKCHYPVEFFAASMTLDMNNTDKLDVLRQEVAKQAIILLPPDVNYSEVEFSVEKSMDNGLSVKKLRYGLAAIKNVGHAAVEKLVAERRANGNFASLLDFAARVEPHSLNKRQVEQMAASGAFDALHPERALVFAAAEGILAQAARRGRERDSNQTALFDNAEPKSPNLAGEGKTNKIGKNAKESEKTLIENGILPVSTTIIAWTDEEKRNYEKAALGFYLTAHPLADYRPRLNAMPEISSSRSLSDPRLLAKNEIRVAALVLECRERTAKSGNKFAFVQLSDEFGGFEVMAFQDILLKHRDMLQTGQKLFLTLKAKEDKRGNERNNRFSNGSNGNGNGGSNSDSGQRLLLDRVQILDEYLVNQPGHLLLSTDSVNAAEAMKELLTKIPRGKIKLSAQIQLDDKIIVLHSNQGFLINQEILKQIRALPEITVNYTSVMT